MTRRKLVAGVFFVLGLGSCQWILGVDNTRPPPPENEAAAMMEGGDPCKRTGLPDPSTDGGSGGGNDWIFALSSVDLGLDGSVKGFNLDRECTCPNDDTCKRPQGKDKACDLANGADNAGLKILEFVTTPIGDAAPFVEQKRLNLLLSYGVSGAIMRVQQYNGEKNDNFVEVSLYPTVGVEGDAGSVRFDGNDVWRLDRESVIDEMDPSRPAKQKSSFAYVLNDTLVALFTDTASIVVGGGIDDPDTGAVQPPIRMDLTQAIISAKIANKGSQLRGGVLTGRWRANDLLKSIEAFPVQFPFGPYLCGDSGGFVGIAGLVCGLRDIAATQTDLKVDCDAISIALGFEAVRAKISTTLGDQPEAGRPCGTGWKPTCPP